jgi:hypothetical protein
MGGNYALLFVIFSLFWDTVFRLRKLILITLKVVRTEIFFKFVIEKHRQLLRLYGTLVKWYWQRKTLSAWRKTCWSATFFKINPTWTGLKLNPGLHSERPVCPSHDTISSEMLVPTYLPTYQPTKYMASLHIRLWVNNYVQQTEDLMRKIWYSKVYLISVHTS